VSLDSRFGEPEAGWVTVALLGKPRGNRGEVTAIALSSKPERYSQLHEVLLAGQDLSRPLQVESTWFHGGVLIFKFRDVDTISDAEPLSGAEVRVPQSERIPLEPGEYFESDLIGSEIVDNRSGETLGRVSGWQDAGGSGLLVIDNDWLIPFACSICVEIDPEARRIAVELPEGLKDLNR
jgi:16S rRNA processing protein RimM